MGWAGNPTCILGPHVIQVLSHQLGYHVINLEGNPSHNAQAVQRNDQVQKRLHNKRMRTLAPIGILQARVTHVTQHVSSTEKLFLVR